MTEVSALRSEMYEVDVKDSATQPLHPSPDRTRSTDNNRVVFVLFGPTHSRKRSLALKLQNEHPSLFTRVVPHTTRAARPLELGGVDYHFVSRDEFLQLVRDGKLLEYIYIGELDTTL